MSDYYTHARILVIFIYNIGREIMENEKGYVEIDLLHILEILWKKIWAVVLAAVIGAMAALLITVLFIPNKYQSSALFYVNNSAKQLSENDTISTESINAAQRLVDTYLVILESRSTLNEVITKAHVDYNYDEIKDMIKGSSMNDTEIFSVTVTSKDPKEAQKIASTIADVLPDKIAEIVDVDSVHVVDNAVAPSHKSSPSNTKNAAIGALLGVVLVAAIIIINDFKDEVIHSTEYFKEAYPELPILANIPDLYGDSEPTYALKKPGKGKKGGK